MRAEASLAANVCVNNLSAAHVAREHHRSGRLERDAQRRRAIVPEAPSGVVVVVVIIVVRSHGRLEPAQLGVANEALELRKGLLALAKLGVVFARCAALTRRRREALALVH